MSSFVSGKKVGYIATIAAVFIAIPTLVGAVSLLTADEPSQYTIMGTQNLRISTRELDPMLYQVTLELRDPASAVFYDLEAERQDNGSLIVCGEVGAKNGFGGYALKEPFYAAKHRPIEVADGEGTVLGALGALRGTDAKQEEPVLDSNGLVTSVWIGRGC